MIKNIFANFIGKFWSILSNFLFVPLYIHYLGFESFSIISFTLVIMGLMTILDGGLTATLSREFARNDNTLIEKIRIFKTTESVYLIIVGFCTLFLFVLSDVIASKWLNLKNFSKDDVSFFIKIISLGIGFQMLFRFYMGGLMGLEKQIKANFFQISWGILRNGLVVFIIMYIPKLEIFFLWQTFSTVVFAIILKFVLNKSLTGYYLYNLMPKIEIAILKSIWRFAGGMLLISLVASLNSQMDKLTISKLLSIESLGYYTIAVSLSMGILIIATPISVALLPRFTALYSSGKSIEASMLFGKINIYIVIIVFAIMANMSFFAEKLIWLWTNDNELATQAYIYLPVIAMSYAMLSLAIFPYNIAIANGYTKLNNQLGLISLFVTLPGYWFATKYYGGIGAASVYCITQILITLIYIYIINKKFLKVVGIKTLFIKQMLFPFFVSLIIAYSFSLILSNMMPTSRIIILIGVGFSTIITLFIMALIFIPLYQLKKILNFKFINK